jgi:HAD superfamily hydrolase (TIGR01509 family)
MFKFFKRDIKLVCFDIDNTLCDFASAERETEAYVAELISNEIKLLQSKILHSKILQSKLKTKKQGVLTNSCSAFTVLKFFNEVKKQHLYNDLDPKSYSRLVWFKETLEHIDESMALGVNCNTIISNAKLYEKKYWESINKSLKNYSGTVSVLEFIKSKGLKLATITDSDGLAGMKDYRMKILGLDKYFDYIITGDDIGLNKPAIENWNKLLELSGLKGKQCIMVGDHPEVDLITAKKLGLITVWSKENLNSDLHWDYVDYEIHDISEIIKIVEKINS